MGHLGALGIDQAPGRDDLEFRIRKQWEADSLLTGKGRELVHGIRADGPDLDAQLLECVEVVLQLTELATAEGSPQTPVEDQQRGSLGLRQGVGLAIRRLQLEGRRRVADLGYRARNQPRR